MIFLTLASIAIAIACYPLGKILGKNALDEVRYLKKYKYQITFTFLLITSSIIVTMTNVNIVSMLFLVIGIASLLLMKIPWIFAVLSILSVSKNPALSIIALLQCIFLLFEGSTSKSKH